MTTLAIQPAFALTTGLLVLLLLGLLFWPQKGLLAIWSVGKANAQRVLLEDALKFLFDSEYKGIPIRLNGFAGYLHISTDKAARLVESLRSIGLVQFQEDMLKLTDAGRSYALRIIRVHRIWERYLADETGVANKEWHGRADLKEHSMSLEAADLLAAQIGNPVFDPHGDPIPSSRGELPAYTGKPLSALKEGELGRIVHIEDEPGAIYAQILALGLYPGMQIYIMDVSEDRIQFAANGEECVLTPLFASNITVESLKEREPLKEKYAALSTLKLGETAEIQAISPSCRGQQRRRLMDLGIVPGTLIHTAFASAAGDPVAYQVMGATVAIRRSQANLIFIKPSSNTKV
ncbi:MAG: metal-dependent transcriptional regulator [Haliscomenobacter sp.]|nr:metal-dependent transcriptional regulator [Haliscomenobacter sp.]